MKIDLHCHTKATKSGDGEGRNVTPSLFKEKIENSDVKIVAITNHNLFDLDQYYELSKEVETFCHVWPGVEIDIKENGSNRWHLIVVSNPKEVEKFSTITKKLFKGDDIDSCSYTLDYVVDMFKELDVIYIAHVRGKEPSASENDCKKLEELVGNSYRVFKETSSEKSMGILANFHFNVLIGSDVKDWKYYEKSTFSELKLPIESFEQFCLLAKRDETVVETLLNKKQPKTLTAHPYTDVDIPITIYEDMNVIFGQKGTGKTEIINSLYNEMSTSGFKCAKYYGVESDEKFSSMLNIKDMVADSAKFSIDDCSKSIKIIKEWIDESPTLFANYTKWKQTEGNNANKMRMKITRATQVSLKERDGYTVHECDMHRITNVVKDIDTIKLEQYLTKEEAIELHLLIEKLNCSIRGQRCEDLIDENSIQLINFTINDIKSHADKSTNSVSKPTTVGLINFVEKRIELNAALNSILRSLDVDEIDEFEKIGFLDEKGDMFIDRKYRMLCERSRTNEFSVGIQILRKIKNELNYLHDHILDENIVENLQALKENLEEKNIDSINAFIGCSKEVVNNNGETYKPSTGEKSMLILQKVLAEEADAYFLDEPELGMGNSYVDSIIRPKLVELSRRYKYVVVATHNANIAVRTLPYTSIYRTHSNGNYSTFVGNLFSNKLKNVDDDSLILNWVEESLKSLEGGREAFYERKDVYESN